jgi:hypothetical protein
VDAAFGARGFDAGRRVHGIAKQLKPRFFAPQYSASDWTTV